MILMTAAASLGQENWKTKNFDQWTKADVERILNDSAWVQKREVRLQYSPTSNVAAGSFLPGVASAGGFSGNASSRVAGNTVKQGNIQPAVDFTFALRLRSSMAVRLALVRQMQLATDTEKLSETDFEEYKKKLTGLYQCPACADNYVIALTSSSKENKNYDAVYTAFSGARIEELKTYIFLKNERGEKRELVHFTPPKAPGDEAIFFFRRLDEKGKPLFTKNSKSIIFNTTKNEVNSVTNFKLNVAPLVVGEKVDF